MSSGRNELFLRNNSGVEHPIDQGFAELARAQYSNSFVVKHDGPFQVKRIHSIVRPQNVDRTYWQKRGWQRRSRSISSKEKLLLLLAVRCDSRRDPLTSRGTDTRTPDCRRQ